MRINWQSPSVRTIASLPAALVASLDDPLVAGLCALPPTPADIVDRARPGAAGRERFQERRSLLRAFAGECIDCPGEIVTVSYDGDGAPQLVAPQPALWISTAGRHDLAAVACAQRPVGIDLEVEDESLTPVDDVLHPFERAALRPLDPAARAIGFLRIWTMKEAYLKARRTGFRRDPCSVAILEPGDDGVRIEEKGVTMDCLAEWRRLEFPDRTALVACVVLNE